MHMRLESTRDDYQYGRAPAGRSVTGPEITVEQEEDGPGINLILDPGHAETLDDRDIIRGLTSAEARELAGMLWHHAEEADRRMGLR